LNVEGLKHDLSGELPIFRRVHGWLGQQEVVVRWLSAHVLVDAALPVGFHIVPVLDDAMPDWVVDGWRETRRRGGEDEILAAC
jgi:hypothetical protein